MATSQQCQAACGAGLGAHVAAVVGLRVDEETQVGHRQHRRGVLGPFGELQAGLGEQLAETGVDPFAGDRSHDGPAQDDLWLRRTSIICQLTHKEATDVDLLAEAIEANLETTRDGERTAYGSVFWIRKAIGWALRQHGRVDPQWVLDYVAAHGDRMSGLTKREALKHLR